MTKLINNLPNLIKQWLAEDKTRTQRDLAKQSGLDEATLSRIINSNRPIVDLDKAAELKRIIGFDLSELILEVEA